MCQMKAKISTIQEGELLIEDVTSVEARDGAVTVNSFFEPPRVFAGATIQGIDCTDGVILVVQAGKGARA